MLCTDIGGTSFDIALTDGRSEITQTPDIARFVLAMPLIKIDSIGAGTGSFVRVNRTRTGPSWGRIGRLADRDLLARGAGHGLGHRPQPGAGEDQPDYFLGGDIQLDAEKAHAEVERQVARPLGLGVEDAAAGVVSLFEQTLRNEAVGRILGKGYSPADYSLLCYGGGGPLHVAGYTEGVPYRDVRCRPGRPGSPHMAAPALRSSTATTRRSTCRSAGGAEVDEMEKAGIGMMVTGAWLGLQEKVAEEFAKSGVAREAIEFGHAVRMQYYGQLNDIEIVSPRMELEEGRTWTS